MARYFFHVVNSTFIPDNSGTECATPEEVKAQAIVAAGEALRDQALEVWNTGHWDMFICDEQNNTHLRLSFHAADLTGEIK